MAHVFAKDMKRDFTQGPIFTRIFTFAIPLMLSGLLQVLYNMADSIVVGRFSTDPLALAAIGSTNVFYNLILGFLLGFSSGAGVVVAQYFGAKDEENIKKSIHTSMSIAVISSLIFSVITFLLTRWVLTLMGTKPELLDGAVLYVHIIALGIPASVIYNFGASILRSIGDSKSSLYVLAFSGIVNVVLNLLFVIVLKMTVDGVAYATVISQCISAVSVVIIMCRQKGYLAFSPKHLSLDKRIVLSVIRLGLPTGLSTSVFALSNLIITKAFNTFSTIDIYARTVVTNVDSVVTTISSSYKSSTLTFSAQNYGARNYKRVKKTLYYSLFQGFLLTFTISQIMLMFAVPISRLYIGEGNPDMEAIIATAKSFFNIMLNLYFIAILLNVFEAWLQSIGYAIIPTIISFTTVVVFRVIWVYAIFPIDYFHTTQWLMASFPISWSIAVVAYVFVSIFAFYKLRLREKELAVKTAA